MWAITQTDFIKNRLEMTCTKVYENAKMIVKRDVYMKFFDVARPLYLETNASRIVLVAGLLQVRDSMNCGHDKVVSDNEILQLIAFDSTTAT